MESSKNACQRGSKNLNDQHLDHMQGNSITMNTLG